MKIVIPIVEKLCRTTVACGKKRKIGDKCLPSSPVHMDLRHHLLPQGKEQLLVGVDLFSLAKNFTPDVEKWSE